jgi:orotidine-5'-phosphate decarboxylase
MRSNNPVFIALDFPNAQATLAFLDKFNDVKPAVKIGMELFYAEGPSIVRAVRERGHEVFLDLKLYDIPNTVANAVRSLADLDVQYLTVHASGGIKMMQAAVEAALDVPMKILAVTKLTSLSEREMRDNDLTDSSMVKMVEHLAILANYAGVDGTISSPLEAKNIKDAIKSYHVSESFNNFYRNLGPEKSLEELEYMLYAAKEKYADTPKDFLRITPGIRLAGDDAGDQARITTPAKARQLGSTGLVVGRSITGAVDPVAAYQRVMTEWSK